MIFVDFTNTHFEPCYYQAVTNCCGRTEGDDKYMSEILDKIESLASGKKIFDQELIGIILDTFLDLRFSEIAKNERFESFMPEDLANGLHLEKQAVSGCTVRELLVLIGMESDEEWFDIPDKDREYFDKERFSAPDKDKEFFRADFPNSACHCLMLAGMLSNKGKKNTTLARLMDIDYEAFLIYLGNIPVKAGLKSFDDPDMVSRRSELVKEYCHMIYLVYEYLFKDTGMSFEQVRFTLGDVINTAYKQGSAMWLCGIQPLTEHAKSVRRAYLIANNLFAEIMNGYLISMDRQQSDALLQKCKTAGAQAVYDICQTFDPGYGTNVKGD